MSSAFCYLEVFTNCSIAPNSAALTAAELFIANFTDCLSAIDYTIKHPRQAIRPFYALTRTLQSLTVFGGDRLLRLYAHLSKLPKEGPNHRAALIRLKSNDSAATFPPTLDSWRSLITQFDLDNTLPLVVRMAAPHWMAGEITISTSD